MNKFFEKLSTYTIGKAFIIGLAVAGFYYFTLYNDGSAIDAQIATFNQQLQQEEAKKKDTDATLKQVREMQDKVGRLSTQYQEISRRLQSALFSIDINKSIDGFGRNAGVNIKAKKPGENVRKEVVEEVPVEIELEGSYSELAQFVYLVSSAERMSRVKNIVISDTSPNGGSRKLNFKGQVVGYKLAPEKPKAETTK